MPDSGHRLSASASGDSHEYSRLAASTDNCDDLPLGSSSSWAAHVTSLGLIFDAASGRAAAADWILDAILAAERAMPLVTVLEAARTGSVLTDISPDTDYAPRVTKFGQSGDLDASFRGSTRRRWPGSFSPMITRKRLPILRDGRWQVI